jgi:alkanesulfonate monooxygenase SsuD/methylene tetrahydromethanopterin reductase-like flavin-dependent oxidoreductase (luciferase family)
MKKIGFLSFGHWTPSPQSKTRSAADALLQSIDLAVAAEELGADGAYFRVHHFARQLGSPFPLLAAAGAKTKRIELGTAVIDMRYENPLYMVEDAGAADLIAGGRLQLGISRGSPEQVIDGWRYFGYAPPEGMSDAEMARNHTEVLLEVLRGNGSPIRNRCFRTLRACCASSPIRRACATASGGAPAPTPRPNGPPSSA